MSSCPEAHRWGEVWRNCAACFENFERARARAATRTSAVIGGMTYQAVIWLPAPRPAMIDAVHDARVVTRCGAGSLLSEASDLEK